LLPRRQVFAFGFPFAPLRRFVESITGKKKRERKERKKKKKRWENVRKSWESRGRK